MEAILLYSSQMPWGTFFGEATRTRSFDCRATLDGTGRPAVWPDIVDYARHRTTRVVLAACHRDHDPTNNRPRNLVALYQRCHLAHDRAENRRRFRITILRRRALGDLFLGIYRS
jgi:hypothetical protein